MIQKAVEMGVGRVRPVITRHTQVSRINLDRMVANAIEAAEQCGVLSVPIVEEEVRLDRLLDRFAEDEPGRRLIFCDEGEETTNPLPALSRLGPGPVAVLIGPEGGFAEEERARLRGLPFVTAVPLGPRILRADTAAVAALAVVRRRSATGEPGGRRGGHRDPGPRDGKAGRVGARAEHVLVAGVSERPVPAPSRRRSP